MQSRFFIFIIATIVCFITACSTSGDKPQQSQNDLSLIVADESLKPMMEQIRMTYEATHINTNIKVEYQPEQAAISNLLSTKAELVFVVREFTDNERQVMKQKGTIYRPQPVATDGVALIVHKSNTDSLITLDNIKNIFNKKIKNWEQLPKAHRSGKIVLVFDNANASNINYMMLKTGVRTLEGLNIFAAGDNQKVIEYVRKNANAVGFIGVNWISDGDEPLTKELSKGLRVMGVAEKAGEAHYQPFQRDLRYKRYPLRRTIYAVSHVTGSTRPGSKFLNYIMRDVGGLIIEKCGLWPKYPYKREIIINKEL